jgi:hypothetical protein
MLAKCLAVLVVLVSVFVSSVLAQDSLSSTPVNQISATGGRTFVSTQTIRTYNIPLHFGNPASVAFNYGRLLKSRSIFGLYAELPVAMFFSMDLNTPHNLIPKDIGGLFVTPSARLNFFYGDSVTPWVSAGGGYGRFRESSQLNFFGRNPGPTGTNTGVAQFGAGVDVWFWRKWGFRAEARDFYSGVPALNADTGRSRQHNYYVGAGIARRF